MLDGAKQSQLLPTPDEEGYVFAEGYPASCMCACP